MDRALPLRLRWGTTFVITGQDAHVAPVAETATGDRMRVKDEQAALLGCSDARCAPTASARYSERGGRRSTSIPSTTGSSPSTQPGTR